MLKTIIIDDETSARNDLLDLLTAHCGEVRVVAVADSAMRGKELIIRHRPDLVFLTIEMPHKNGFEMLEELGDCDFNIILVGAHERHAIKAIKYSALDYLLKPLSVGELTAAVKRAAKLRIKTIT